MDSDEETDTPTQATQNVLDPRRYGKQNTGFSDTDMADIICLLLPYSDSARAELHEMAIRTSLHMVDADEAAHPELQPAEGLSHMPRLVGEHALVLRLSAQCKDPLMGFTFGRSRANCDIVFGHDPSRRISNVHFRIFYNEYGSLMIEDSSSNGTIIDDRHMLKAKPKPGERACDKLRTLTPGCTIKLLMARRTDDLCFVVQVPRRDGDYEEAFRKNLTRHMRHLNALRRSGMEVDLGRTITPGPGGHVDLFPVNDVTRQTSPRGIRQLALPDELTQDNMSRTPREWNGSGKYNRIEKIGQGAFATVYKVTAKFDGRPYAAKEIDKLKFIKNGVLDQKIENEMKIMQRVKHPHIIEYVEHFDWQNRLTVIIMEHLPNGDLSHLITSNTALMEPIVQQTAGQLLSALSYLHANNITHRDVKPDNILIASYTPFVVKLTDFGLSKIVEGNQTFLKTFCGTLLYCAPEVYMEFSDYDDDGHRRPRNRPRGRLAGQRYDHAIDIWSLGGVLHYLLTTQPPFPAKAGITYSELLHQIMTRPFDANLLEKYNVSTDGTDFLLSMLEKRPEQRATVEELLAHPWMKEMWCSQGRNGAGGSQEDQEIDDALGKGASQLSLDDTTSWARSRPDDDDNEVGQDEDAETELCYQDDIEAADLDCGNSQRGVDATGQFARPRKLYGEVSATDSSEAMNSTRLNFTVSPENPKVTQIFDPEIQDSYGSEDPTPRQDQQSQSTPRPAATLAALTQSQRSASDPITVANDSTIDAGLQDLGGAESQLENLNMKSLAPSRGDLTSLNSSKRKTALDASDECDTTPRMRPPVKRLRSNNNMHNTSGISEMEQVLCSHVPPIIRMRSNRQIDKAVHKSVYWDARDKQSWHLNYPEMSQLQYDAFSNGATKRGETFSAGQSPLWNLAMKHFPPGGSSTGPSATTQSSDNGSVSDTGLKVSTRRYSMQRVRSLRDPLSDENKSSMPTQKYNSLIPTGGEPPLNRVVATLESVAGSVVPGVSVHINQTMISWGRAADNTHVHTPKTESKVPKNALKIMLWKEGYEAHKDFRPWSMPSEAAFFYISTKANYGIRVNRTILQSVDPKDVRGPSHNWIRLYDGDNIVFWKSGDGEERSQAKLLFRCDWGGSSGPRDHMAEIVSEPIAKCLDAACRKAEERVGKLAEYDYRLQQADYDASERQTNIERERHRSKEFELHRLEACRLLAMRTTKSSRRDSPTVTSPLAPPSSRH